MGEMLPIGCVISQVPGGDEIPPPSLIRDRDSKKEREGRGLERESALMPARWSTFNSYKQDYISLRSQQIVIRSITITTV
jgi:hypothetical protein